MILHDVPTAAEVMYDGIRAGGISHYYAAVSLAEYRAVPFMWCSARDLDTVRKASLRQMA